jgi:hypothetical protein
MAVPSIAARPARSQVRILGPGGPELIRADVREQIRFARLPGWCITSWRLVRRLEVAP